ncbi:MAG: hypothetical protein ACRDNI_10340 [Gaiellaceae bacterium]
MPDEAHNHGPGEAAELSSPRPTGATPVPLAEPIGSGGEEAFTPGPEGPEIPEMPMPGSPPGRPAELDWPRHHLKLCRINLKEGCYKIRFTPNIFVSYHGTLRVDKAGGTTTISGDLYRYRTFLPLPRPPFEAEVPWHERAALAAERELELTPATRATLPTPFIKKQIPIYPRNRYYSYLRIVGIKRSPLFTYGPCTLTLTAEEYVYTQPPVGSFNGTFPPAPGTRTVEIVLERKTPSPFSGGPYFEGRLYEAGADKGAFTMQWVSKFFRRATLEIDTLVGSVSPQPVDGESFQTVLRTAGWALKVEYDQVNVPVPTGVTPTNCWSSADLHALMLTVRKPTTDLDKEWRLHLVVVPAQLGCGRGVMYDQIVVPREGVASFSDDGYPSADSANFDAAENEMQRDVPRAFLRSASHEVGHGFNQIHQEQEAGADNSIMTTTPSVADVLGAAGTFPDDINLAFNDHVRHHLVHFPDIVVRPGGMTFGSGHISTVPEADRYEFDPSELELRLQASEGRVDLGEPLRLEWTLENHAGAPIPVPSDITVEAQHASLSVARPGGVTKRMPSFVIRTDHVAIADLAPGESLEAESHLYWSSNGFAFETPGKHTVTLRIQWNADGVPCGVSASTDVWVNYPQAPADNEAAALLLHPQVGIYVALGGGANHLHEAVARLDLAGEVGTGDAAPAALRGYDGLEPAKATRRTSGKTRSRKTTSRKRASAKKS